jgi:hypothetical protein
MRNGGLWQQSAQLNGVPCYFIFYTHFLIGNKKKENDKRQVSKSFIRVYE